LVVAYGSAQSSALAIACRALADASGNFAKFAAIRRDSLRAAGVACRASLQLRFLNIRRQAAP
jgi:hypothetical protein